MPTSYRIVYASNGQPIGDGIRLARISNEGQAFEILVDEKAERWSGAILKPVASEDPVDDGPAGGEPVDEEPVDEEPVDPTPPPNPTPSPDPGPIIAADPQTLLTALQNAPAGATVAAAAAHYGDIVLANIGRPDAPEMCVVLDFVGATCNSLTLVNCHNLTVSGGIVIGRESGNPINLVLAEESSTGCMFTGMRVLGAQDAANYVNWSADRWRSRPNGFYLAGNGNRVERCIARGVSHGISTDGDDCQQVNSRVEGFAGDASRANGDRCVVAGNHWQDSFKVSENHDNGFQSWRIKGRPAVDGLVIARNTYIERTYPKSHPLRSDSEGIGMHDGPFTNLMIINNRIAVTAWHGINVAGAQGATISGNMVVNCDGLDDARRPWIAIPVSKQGDPALNVTIENNAVARLDLVSANGEGQNIVVRNNTVIGDHAQFFAANWPEMTAISQA